MSSRAESYCPHFYEQHVGLPGTNIDPVTSQLGGANNNSRKLLILFSILHESYLKVTEKNPSYYM